MSISSRAGGSVASSIRDSKRSSIGSQREIPRSESHQSFHIRGHSRQLSASQQWGPSAAMKPSATLSPMNLPKNSGTGDRERERDFSRDILTYGRLSDEGDSEGEDFPLKGRSKLGYSHDDPIFTPRGLANLGCLVVLLFGIFTLFVGYPIITAYRDSRLSTLGAYNLGGINGTGQKPLITNMPTLIDPDTPTSAISRTGFDGETYTLAFSDEFNRDGRTFFPGDDPYWTAVDIHYWPTGDLEWYDPSAITTRNGNLEIKMTQESINELNFKSGMLQSWNQLCFQYSAFIEVSLSLPGDDKVAGFWPGVWMMGNLGRPGYGATTDGTWPYSYDSCDVGTLENQTTPDGTGPAATIDTESGFQLSVLPGQKLSACTCNGEDHPGPTVGTGRGVPEIDAVEATVLIDRARGQVSQSVQFAPFDDDYNWNNDSSSTTLFNSTATEWNSYVGGEYQQAVSYLTYTEHEDYTDTNGDFGTYGFEFYSNPSARDSGHITWMVNDEMTWTMAPRAVGPNPRTQIGQRLITEEPMSMILNFGMSTSFQTVDLNHLKFPATMLIDYIRVYQRGNGVIGCDPPDHPTAKYIRKHENAYTNPNLTTWAEAGYVKPRNSLIDTC